MKKYLRYGWLCCLCILVAGCVRTYESRGYTWQEKNFTSIVPEKTSKEEVLQLLGSPTTQADYGHETWYYISSKVSRVAFLDPKTEEQKVIQVTFTPEGKVKELQQYDLKKAQKVAFINEKTPTEGNDLTFWQQLLGNIGRFNPQGGPMRNVNRSAGRTPGKYGY